MENFKSKHTAVDSLRTAAKRWMDNMGQERMNRKAHNMVCMTRMWGSLVLFTWS